MITDDMIEAIVKTVNDAYTTNAKMPIPARIIIVGTREIGCAITYFLEDKGDKHEKFWKYVTRYNYSCEDNQLIFVVTIESFKVFLEEEMKGKNLNEVQYIQMQKCIGTPFEVYGTLIYNDNPSCVDDNDPAHAHFALVNTCKHAWCYEEMAVLLPRTEPLKWAEKDDMNKGVFKKRGDTLIDDLLIADKH